MDTHDILASSKVEAKSPEGEKQLHARKRRANRPDASATRLGRWKQMLGAPDSVPAGGFRYLGFPGVAQTWADGSGGTVGSGSGADGEPGNTLLPRLVSQQRLSRTHPRRRRGLEKPVRRVSGLQDSRDS